MKNLKHFISKTVPPRLGDQVIITEKGRVVMLEELPNGEHRMVIEAEPFVSMSTSASVAIRMAKPKPDSATVTPKEAA